MMYRYILTALTAGVILLAFAALPPMLSGTALAQKKDPTTNALNLNTSRSNKTMGVEPKGSGTTQQPIVDRMGGGGGVRGGGARMGGGGGATKAK
jgi:uncharacterized membrane protein YgcG